MNYTALHAAFTNFLQGLSPLMKTVVTLGMGLAIPLVKIIVTGGLPTTPQGWENDAWQAMAVMIAAHVPAMSGNVVVAAQATNPPPSVDVQVAAAVKRP